MTPELARALLARIQNEIGVSEDRGMLSSNVLAALCRGGFAKEAWDLVTIEQGTQRGLEIGTIFLHPDCQLKMLLDIFDSLRGAKDRSHALFGLMRRLSAEDLIAQDFSTISLNSPEENRIVAARIKELINEVDQNIAAELLTKAISLMGQEKLDIDDLSQLLAKDTVNGGMISGI